MRDQVPKTAQRPRFEICGQVGIGIEPYQKEPEAIDDARLTDESEQPANEQISSDHGITNVAGQQPRPRNKEARPVAPDVRLQREVDDREEDGLEQSGRRGYVQDAELV